MLRGIVKCPWSLQGLTQRVASGLNLNWKFLTRTTKSSREALRVIDFWFFLYMYIASMSVVELLKDSYWFLFSNYFFHDEIHPWVTTPHQQPAFINDECYSKIQTGFRLSTENLQGKIGSIYTICNRMGLKWAEPNQIQISSNSLKLVDLRRTWESADYIHSKAYILRN